jgi:hypothetical protein
MKSVFPGKYLRKEKLCPEKNLRKYNGNDLFG